MNFSADAYYFVKTLQQTLHVPVGLIGSYWGGTFIEIWTPRQGYDLDPEVKTILKKWNALPNSKKHAVDGRHNVEVKIFGMRLMPKDSMLSPMAIRLVN